MDQLLVSHHEACHGIYQLGSCDDSSLSFNNRKTPQVELLLPWLNDPFSFRGVSGSYPREQSQILRSLESDFTPLELSKEGLTTRRRKG